VSTLALDARTKVPVRVAGKQARDRAIATGMLQLPGVVNQIIETLQKPELTRSDDIRMRHGFEFLSRFGIPRRTNIDMNLGDHLTLAEKREIYEKALERHLTNPQGGMVQAVNVEFEDVTGAVGVQ